MNQTPPPHPLTSWSLQIPHDPDAPLWYAEGRHATVRGRAAREHREIDRRSRLMEYLRPHLPYRVRSPLVACVCAVWNVLVPASHMPCRVLVWGEWDQAA